MTAWFQCGNLKRLFTFSVPASIYVEFIGDKGNRRVWKRTLETVQC